MGMKRKTIKAVLQKKFNDFLASIEDTDLRERVANNTIITGGSIASMLLGEKVNDYDLYFRDFETAKRVAEYYVNQFARSNPESAIQPKVEIDGDRVKVRVRSSGVASESLDDGTYRYFEADPDPDAADATLYAEQAATVAEQADDDKPRYRPVFLTTNAITLSHGIQLVLRFYGDPDEIHENYDFAHCTSYWDARTKHLELRPYAMEALLAKELRYIGSRYPICSIMRARKFIQRGWTINAGNILKMAMQISDLDLTDVNTLEEQLTGVDVAYFQEIIAKLKEDESVARTGQVSTTYLCEILDRMF